MIFREAENHAESRNLLLLLSRLKQAGRRCIDFIRQEREKAIPVLGTGLSFEDFAKE